MVCFGMNFLRWMFRAGVIGMAIVNPLPPCFGGRHSTVNGSDKSVQNGSIYLPNVTTLIKKGLGMKNRLWQMIELYLINLLEGNSITKSNFFQITKYKVVTALGSDHTCLCRWQVRHDSFVKSHLLWLKCGNSLSHNTLIQEEQNTCLNSRNQFFLMNSMKRGEVENDFCYIYRGVDNL